MDQNSMENMLTNREHYEIIQEKYKNLLSCGHDKEVQTDITKADMEKLIKDHPKLLIEAQTACHNQGKYKDQPVTSDDQFIIPTSEHHEGAMEEVPGPSHGQPFPHFIPNPEMPGRRTAGIHSCSVLQQAVHGGLHESCRSSPSPRPQHAQGPNIPDLQNLCSQGGREDKKKETTKKEEKEETSIKEIGKYYKVQSLGTPFKTVKMKFRYLKFNKKYKLIPEIEKSGFQLEGEKGDALQIINIPRSVPQPPPSRQGEVVWFERTKGRVVWKVKEETSMEEIGKYYKVPSLGTPFKTVKVKFKYLKFNKEYKLIPEIEKSGFQLEGEKGDTLQVINIPRSVPQPPPSRQGEVVWFERTKGGVVWKVGMD